jgi:hypothetical protein
MEFIRILSITRVTPADAAKAIRLPFPAQDERFTAIGFPDRKASFDLARTTLTSDFESLPDTTNMQGSIETFWNAG